MVLCLTLGSQYVAMSTFNNQIHAHWIRLCRSYHACIQYWIIIGV